MDEIKEEVVVGDTQGEESLHEQKETVEVPKEKTQEEINKEILERKMEVQKRYVRPHLKVSRTVTEADIPRVLEEGQIMRELCLFGNGYYSSAFAVAHPQIDDQDPLAFYVDVYGKSYINPVITRHTNYLVDKEEGCLSFPEEPMITVKRWHKVEVDYQTLIWEGEGEEKKTILSEVIHEGLSGEDAQIVQHECDHLVGKYIYPSRGESKDYTYLSETENTDLSTIKE